MKGCLLGVVLLVALATGMLWYAMGRTMSAPVWLRDQIESRLAVALPGFQVDFGDLRLQLQGEGLTRIALSDVAVRSPTSAQIAVLSDLEVGLAPTRLLLGQYELREVRLTGAMLTMRRDEEGRIGLALGDVFAADTPAPDLPTIIAQLDQLAADPRLAGLSLVTAEALTIRYEDARAGRGWTADGGRLQLTRDAGSLRLSGDVALLGQGDVAATMALNADSLIGQTSARFGMNLEGLAAQDIASQSPALAWLNGLRAPISGALRGDMAADGALGALSATLQIGKGVLQPRPETRPIRFEGARSYFSYDPATATLQFDEISVTSRFGTLVTDGRAVLGDIRRGMPQEMVGQFRISRLEADPAGVFATPLKLAGAELDWRLSFAPFRFELGRLRIADAALPLRASGVLAAEQGGWRLAVDARLDSATPEQILAVWPASALPPTRRWVAENIHAGRLRDALVSLRLEPGGTLEPYLDMRIEGVELSYSPSLPRLMEAEGQVSFYQNRLSATVDSGRLIPPEGGEIDASGSSFVIPDLRERPNIGEVNVVARGPLVAALSYLDQPPLEILTKANKPVTLGSGSAEITGQVVLPLEPHVPREAVTVRATAVLRDVQSDQIVPGRVLQAERLDVAVDDTQVAITGSADLSGVPFTGTWTQPLAPGMAGRVEGDVVLSDAVARALGIGLPAGTFSGLGVGGVGIDLPPGEVPSFALRSDLAGLGVALPQIGWRLSEGGTGTLEVAGRLGAPVTVDRLVLQAAGLRAEGSVTLNADGSFDRLSLPVLQAGDWLQGGAVLTGRGRNAVPAVALRGALLDMRRAPLGAGGGGGGAAGGPVEVAVDRLQVTDNIAVEGFQGSFDTSGGLTGSFTGRVGGRAPISGDVVPRNGASAFRIRSRDAGDVLKGAGIFQNVQDGLFDMTLVPVTGQAGTYDGLLRIEGARLQKNNVAVALLDGLSIVGILDQLNGPGIFFNEVEARFRMTPDLITLTRASAVGPSMGISMDGYANLGTGMMDLQGVLSPIYILNGLGRVFARKGEGLIGFNFNLRGAMTQPQVSVNPLSVFTPGMFRDIFRRPPPTIDQGN